MLLSQPSNMMSRAPVRPAQLSWPGLVLASSTTSLSVFTGKSIGTEIPMTVLDTRAIGARSSGLRFRIDADIGERREDDLEPAGLCRGAAARCRRGRRELSAQTLKTAPHQTSTTVSLGQLTGDPIGTRAYGHTQPQKVRPILQEPHDRAR